jgi:branched-chain amino acid transport system ATP-binding protein
VLSVDRLSVAIGSSTVLSEVSLEVGQGEVVCLVGRNGAGKTTLLRTLMGFLSPRAGTIRLGGDDVTGRPPHEMARLGVGFSPEDSGVFAGLTVEENVRLAIWAKPAGRAAEERVALAGELFPALRRHWKRPAGQMSGGERKMLSIARALASDPAVLLLDEPFEGLSPAIIPEVAEGIARITVLGRSILMAESNAHHVPVSADRACVLERGEVVFTGPPGRLLSDDMVRRIVEGAELSPGAPAPAAPARTDIAMPERRTRG